MRRVALLFSILLFVALANSALSDKARPAIHQAPIPPPAKIDIEKEWSKKPLCNGVYWEYLNLPDVHRGETEDEEYIIRQEVRLRLILAYGETLEIEELPASTFSSYIPAELLPKARYWRADKEIFAYWVRGGHLVFSRAFFNLPVESRRAVFLHELAHGIPSTAQTVHEIEIEADRRAVCYLETVLRVPSQILFDTLIQLAPGYLNKDTTAHPSHRTRCKAVLGAKCGFNSKYPEAWN